MPLLNIFEPLFLLLVLVTLITLIATAVCAARGQFARAGRILRRLGLGAAVYFAIVIPYQKAREYMDRNKADEAVPLSEDTQLLTEIRDLLAQRNASGGV